ncbi:hypothetical protein AVEN_199053-1 [Araneus ventricosus]|uniref:Uncharacterized protein n=1 Tax=Araneus ventricosus TaxID=182803 RepID=A0A4Y2RQC6_ARAVE|nr:hypothetical protein AVEN_63812-1 [Araneus ventricosus]GBN78027.1 hypothetical protein AVEN_199053-1 [Araneus ventricosus]
MKYKNYYILSLDIAWRLRWLVVRARLWGRNPIPLKIRRVWGLLHVKSYVVAKGPSFGVEWKFGEGVPAQASSSSSDCGSKLRGPSQNIPRVALKLDVNISKLILDIAQNT